MISFLHSQVIFAICQSMGPCTIAYNPCTQFQKKGNITTALCDKTKIFTKTKIKTCFRDLKLIRRAIESQRETGREPVRTRESQREPVRARLNKTLFCRDTSKYGIFCRKLLRYALRAKKMAATALRVDSTLSPTLVRVT